MGREGHTPFSLQASGEEDGHEYTNEVSDVRLGKNISSTPHSSPFSHSHTSHTVTPHTQSHLTHSHTSHTVIPHTQSHSRTSHTVTPHTVTPHTVTPHTQSHLTHSHTSHTVTPHTQSHLTHSHTSHSHTSHTVTYQIILFIKLHPITPSHLPYYTSHHHTITPSHYNTITL